MGPFEHDDGSQTMVEERTAAEPFQCPGLGCAHPVSVGDRVFEFKRRIWEDGPMWRVAAIQLLCEKCGAKRLAEWRAA